MNIATPPPQAERTDIGLGVLCLSQSIYQQINKGVNAIP